MLAPLKNRTYRHLFSAQVFALLGTGLATVALGLLSYEIAGPDAGRVLGTALAIKMIAYVGVSPVAAAFVEVLPRRTVLVSLDLIRAGIALFLPFVDQIWQVYVLIFVLQSSSAAFTPAFQATIPEILPEEREYTEALSLSRLAYDMESLVSPTVAAVLLTVISFHWLFAGTAVGFLASAALVVTVTLPVLTAPDKQQSIYDKTTKGLRIYLATPRLRGLLALNLAAAAGGAMVIVNTVVYVRSNLGRDEADVALALAAFGLGSILAAVFLPRLLGRLTDRRVMFTGGAGLVTGLVAMGWASAADMIGWAIFLAMWAFLGLCYSSVITPSGRLLRRSSHSQDRPALFAAQFALSHACWLVTYPVAGAIGAAYGMSNAFLALGAFASLGFIAALAFWPAHDPAILRHSHEGLPPGHSHLKGGRVTDKGCDHEHAFVIDDLHRRWPHGS